MSVIVYKNYTFHEPAVITSQTYAQLKQQLTLQPNYKINTSKESFTTKFKRSLWFLTFALPITAAAVLCNTVFKDSLNLEPTQFKIVTGVWLLLGVFSMFVLMFMFLEGTSYATYLYNKRNYFIGMEHAVKNSNTYQDFEQAFYGIPTSKSSNYKTIAKEAMLGKKTPITINSSLEWIFRTIDNLLWIIGIIAIGFFIWKYFFAK